MEEGDHGKIAIKKVKDPFCFYGVKVNDVHDEEFNSLQQEIKNYFSNEQLIKQVLFNPEPGNYCIVRSDTMAWDRAVVESLMISPKSYQVKCFLVDKVKTQLVPSNRVLQSPSWIWQLPPKGVKFSLYGLIPLRLKTDYARDKVDMSTTPNWSIAAVEYFQNMVADCDGVCYAKVISVSKDETRFVRLCAKNRATDFSTCVNDDLVEKNFAIFKEDKEYESSSCDQKFGMDTEKIDILKEKAAKSMKKGLEEDMEVFKCAGLFNNFASVNSNIDDVDDSSKLPHAPEQLDVSFADMPELSENDCCEASCDNATAKGRNVSAPAYKESVSKHLDSAYVLMPSLAVSTDDDAACNLDANKISFKKHACVIETNDSSINSNKDTAVPSLVTSCVKENRLDGFGRGRILKDLANTFKISSHPPPIQRRVPNNDLSAFSPELSLKRDKKILQHNKNFICTNNFESNELEESYQLLLSEIHSFQLNFHFLSKLDDIFAAKDLSQTDNNALLAEKIKLLQNLIDEVKHYHKKTNFFPFKDNKSPSFSLKEKTSPKTIASSCGSQKHVDRKENEKRKQNIQPAKSYFSSVSLAKSQQQTSKTTLVHGIDPPIPISLFCDAPFPPFMISMMEAKFRGPTCLQGHVWSAILNKRSVIGISPVGSGKTLAYVAPIVSMLLRSDHNIKKDGLSKTQSTYLQAQSPSVIVLCSSWRNVKVVTDSFSRFLKPSNFHQASGHNVVAIMGGPDQEKANALNLLSGCSVLVCSPFTFLRLYNSKQLSLARLEQLVLDDFHILAEEFTLQIRQVMNAWWNARNDPDCPTISHFKPQLMCFGIQWTPGIENFMKTCLNEPLLYITDPLEFSVYGQVEHMVEMLKEHFVFDHLVSLLKSNWENRTGGVAVFVDSVAKMKDLASALNKLGYSTLEAHSNMLPHELQSLQEYCDEIITAPLLVICDNALPLIDLDTIEVCIHYSFPKDPRTFGMRLSLMRNCCHLKNVDSAFTIDPRSFLIVTEKDFQFCEWLVKFLSRLPKPIPPLLKLVARKTAECNEVGKSENPLCPYLKAYGRCRDIKVCSYRHWLSSKLDEPNANSKYAKIPTTGRVHVYISCVKNATLYYGRIVKHKETDSDTPTVYPDVYEKLCEGLNEFYTNEGRKVSGPPAVGKLYAWKEFDQFYRVKVVFTFIEGFKNEKRVTWKTPGGVTKVRVFLVDNGGWRMANVEDLLVLDPKFEKTPFQAIEIRSCFNRPFDQDTEWSFSANKLVHDLIYEKTVYGQIQHALNHTIWLHPLYVWSKLPKSGVYVPECNVSEELRLSKLAEEAPIHLDFLKKQRSIAAAKPLSASKVLDTNNAQSLHKAISNKKEDLAGAKHQELSTRSSIVNSIDSRNTISFSSKNKLRGSEQEQTLNFQSTCHIVNGQTSSNQSSSNATPFSKATIAKSKHLVADVPVNEMPPLANQSLKTCDDKTKDFLFDEMPPLTGSLPSKTHGNERGASKNAIGISLRKITNKDTSDSTDTDCYHKQNLIQSKLKASPRRRKRQTRRSPNQRRNDSPELPTDDGAESSSTLMDTSSSTIVHSDGSVVSRKCASDESLTPTRFSLMSHTKNSIRSPLSNRNVLSPSSRRKGNIVTKSPRQRQRVQTGQNSSPNLVTASQTECCLPPLVNVFERKSLPGSNCAASTINPPDLILKSFATEVKSSSVAPPSKSSDLPPKKDVNGNGIIYPYYVQLVHSDNVSARLRICENIYIHASQNYLSVSKCDLESLNKALLASHNSRESFLLISTMMTLAHSFVPVEEFIDLSGLIRQFCIVNFPKTSKVPNQLLSFTMFVLDCIIEKYPEQVSELTNTLITFFDALCCDMTLYNKMIIMVEKILKLLERICDAAKQSFINADNDRLLALLLKLPSNTKTDDSRKRLFNVIQCDDTQDVDSAYYAPSKISVKSKTISKQVNAAKKDYDPFNYDRFNNIDTGSDSDTRRSRPYSPIPVRFDSETETSVTETDSDTDFLPGM